MTSTKRKPRAGIDETIEALAPTILVAGFADLVATMDEHRLRAQLAEVEAAILRHVDDKLGDADYQRARRAYDPGGRRSVAHLAEFLRWRDVFDVIEDDHARMRRLVMLHLERVEVRVDQTEDERC